MDLNECQQLMRMISLIILLFELVNANYTQNSKLVDQALYVTNKYFSYQYVTSVVWIDTDPIEVNEFLHKYPGSRVVVPIINTNNNNTFNTEQLFDNYYKQLQTIVFVRGATDLVKYVIHINQNSILQNRIVLVLTEPLKELTKLSDYFKIAWSSNLADILIISMNLSNEINFSTYFPYSNGVCGNYEPVTLNHNDNMFPNKFNNFHKCPIRASVMPYEPYVYLEKENGIITGISGYDGMTMMIIKDAVNATFQYIDVSSDNKGYGSYTNGIPSGVFRDLVFNKIDIVIPAGVLSRGRFSITHASHVYYSLNYRWIGPKRREINRWMRILLPFFDNLTPLLCLTFIMFVLLVTFIKRFKLRISGRTTCFQTFTVLLGQSSNFISKAPVINYLFLLWIWFCFIIRIDYQGDLIDYIQKPILEAPFETLEDAIKRVDNHGGFEVMLDFYRDTPIENGYTVIPITTVDGIISMIAEGKRYLLVVDTCLFQRHSNSVQVLNVIVSTTYTCFYMRRGWPAAQTIDTLILRVQEAGLKEKIRNMKGDEYKPELAVENTKAYPLDMSIFSACFYVMCLMWFICSMILVVEIMYYKYTGNNGSKPK